MASITINASEASIIRSREELAGFLGALDEKRPGAWRQYGWPDVVSFEQMRLAHERTGPGHGAIYRLLDGCWQSLPRIKTPDSDKPTAWEKKTSEVLKAINAWAKLVEFDRRNMVGRYSALIYRVNDGKPLDEPLEHAAKLVDLIPLFEDQIKVTDWVSDKKSPDYGKPAKFQYRSRRVGEGDTQGMPIDWVDVHPSRVQMLAEGSVGDFFDGVPVLRAGFNSLVDLEKISGGSAESFLKNSARTIVFQYDPNATVQAITNDDGTTSSVREVHEEQTRALNRNQDSSIVLQGGQANTLQTIISDPTKPFEVAANMFAASVRLPFTILFGQQTGRLASDEDKADAIARYKGRQNNVLTQMLTEFVTRMQAAGVIDQGAFVVEWEDIAAPSDDQKLSNLNKMTAAMQQAFQAGLAEPIFDANELRKVAGFEERSNDGMPGEGDPGNDPPTDPIKPTA